MLRFAPSPTRDINISDLRVALFNYMVSVQNNEDLLIRIEDTDIENNIEGKDKEILEILNLFSISYKYAVHQNDNLKYHSQFAMQLLVNRKAFNCFCGEVALQNDKDEAKENNKPYRYSGFCENLSDAATFECEAPFTVRLKKPLENIKFTDLIQGEFDCKGFDIDSFRILNHNKTPTCVFAGAIDDMLSNISTVIRSEEHITNTAKQIHIRSLLGYDKQINYIHLPFISNDSVQELVTQGYLPAAITNYLISLGYDLPKDENGNNIEIFTLEEALKWFDISKVSSSDASFDIEKLKYINKEHIKAMDELRLSKILGYSDKDIGSLAKVYLEQCDTISQIKVKIDDIFKPRESNKEFEVEFEKIISCLKDAPYIENYNDFEKYIQTNTNIQPLELMTPLRFVLTNTTSGPQLSEIYPLIRNYLGVII